VSTRASQLGRVLPYYPGMTSFKWIRVAASLYGLSFVLVAQTTDWHSVEKLAPRTAISVVERSRRGCVLVKVTGADLSCAGETGGRWRILVIAREQVQEVRLETPEHNRMITGAILGGIVGGVLGFVGTGQSSDPETRGYARVYGIPIGAFVGGAIGRNFHSHGAVIYRRR